MSEQWSNWVPILSVKDARASAQFYEQVLGFTIDWEHRFEEGFPLYVQVSRPPLTLHLNEHGGGAGGKVELFVRVPDVDALYQGMLDRGTKPETEPTTQSYGIRDFSVVDPDGHRITLGAPAGFPACSVDLPVDVLQRPTGRSAQRAGRSAPRRPSGATTLRSSVTGVQ